MVDNLAGSDVNYRDPGMISAGEINLLAVIGHPHTRWEPSLRRKLVDDLLRGFIHYQHAVGMGAKKDRSSLRDRTSNQQKDKRSFHYGNTKSRFRQSLVADAHLAVQSGALLR